MKSALIRNNPCLPASRRVICVLIDDYLPDKVWIRGCQPYKIYPLTDIISLELNEIFTCFPEFIIQQPDLPSVKIIYFQQDLAGNWQLINNFSCAGERVGIVCQLLIIQIIINRYPCYRWITGRKLQTIEPEGISVIPGISMKFNIKFNIEHLLKKKQGLFARNIPLFLEGGVDFMFCV